MHLHELVTTAKKKFFEQVKNDLTEAEIFEDEKKFLEKGAKYSLAFGLLSAAFLLSFFEDVLFGALLSAGCFFVCAFAWLYYPKMKKKKIAGRIEKHLPFFLFSLGMQVKVGVPLEKALESLVKNERNELSRQVEETLRQAKEGGISLQNAFFLLSQRTSSAMLKRALAQMVFVYENGPKEAQSLFALAKEQLATQRAKGKEFSGKLALYSVVFIAVSTILPSLFSAIMLVGSSFLEIELSPLQLLLVMCVFFPALDIAALAVIKSLTPEFMK